MRFTGLVLALGSAVLVGCQQAATLTPAQENIERQFIQDRLNDWSRLMNNAAIDSVAAMYVDGESTVLVLPNGSRGTGTEGVQNTLLNLYNSIQFMNFNPQNPQIDVLTATTAVVTFRHSMDLVLADTRRDPFAGSGTLVMVKDPVDDVWRIHTQHLSRNP